MKHSWKQHVKHARVALAVAAAFAALGSGATEAQDFKAAGIAVDRLGDLTCTFREAGLVPYQAVTYTCGAGAAVVWEQCFHRNKPSAGSRWYVVTGVEEGPTLVAKNNGMINGSITAPVPAKGGTEPPLCADPLVAVTTAVRWCDPFLMDDTNNVLGTHYAEIYVMLQRTTLAPGAPTCAELTGTP